MSKGYQIREESARQVRIAGAPRGVPRVFPWTDPDPDPPRIPERALEALDEMIDDAIEGVYVARHEGHESEGFTHLERAAAAIISGDIAPRRITGSEEYAMSVLTEAAARAELSELTARGVVGRSDPARTARDALAGYAKMGPLPVEEADSLAGILEALALEAGGIQRDLPAGVDCFSRLTDADVARLSLCAGRLLRLAHHLRELSNGL
jgi:hypothetical protein